MHDLKFEEAVRIGKSFSPEHINMFPECEKEARIFTASIASAKALLIVPGFAMAFGAMNQHCKEWADREVVKSGKLFASKEEMIEYVADLGGDRMGDAADGFLQNQEAYLQAASADLYDYAKITPRIMTALEDSLKAVVILTWTAVEVLIQDLWKNAQSKVPVIFVTPTEKERNGKNNISGELKKMGFISRSAFRNIYAWSFRVDNAEILSKVGDLALDNLSLMRNSLVHDAGIPSARFLKDTADFTFFDPYRGLPPDTAIPFTGELLRDLVEPAISISFDLIESVDDWIKLHK